MAPKFLYPTFPEIPIDGDDFDPHASSEYNPMLKLLLDGLKPMRHNRLHNYILPGLMSDIVGGAEHGKVRVFESVRETTEWLTPHSHRFDLTVIVLAGQYTNIEFTKCDDENLRNYGELYCPSTIHQVCGEGGRLLDNQHERHSSPVRYSKGIHKYGAGEGFFFQHNRIHSVKFEKGTVALLLESPPVAETSVMLEPWVDGRCVPTFKVEDWMFQREV